MTQPPSVFGIRVPDRVHPAADHIGRHLMAWAVHTGLASDGRDMARLDSAGYHLAAARVLPDAAPAGVELFAEWTVWLFHLDDEQDQGAMGRSAASVAAGYDAITAVMAGRPAPAGASPAVTAAAALWPRTAGRMSPAWSRRFLAHIHDHRDAFIAQAAHRAGGTLPTPEQYPALRRNDNAMFLYDLVEVAHRTEIPPELAGDPHWTELCAASSDIGAWCNDLLSLDREAANGETTNYVTVLEHATGAGRHAAVEQVRALITRRSHDLAAAADACLARAADLAPRTDPDGVRRVVATIVDMPGAYVAWMLASGRYEAPLHPAP
ncbi:terpene synthase family protein [Streptomyces sp. NPDC001985]|uniref:terpene synthase family protein n=1 Tax=Streptomyces sp. NPDC001985 TaxID=3154406 RepID=UPI00331B467F